MNPGMNQPLPRLLIVLALAGLLIAVQSPVPEIYR